MAADDLNHLPACCVCFVLLLLQVVVGVVDPNPLVASAGIATLQQVGIEVSIMDGAENRTCFDINAEFMERMAAEAAATAKGG
jgi:diaminohydroxyphosphoribosylaminopyrimidine deaminase/5-amino-6-(5-phosphoribosylamino)uracil reductase